MVVGDGPFFPDGESRSNVRRSIRSKGRRKGRGFARADEDGKEITEEGAPDVTGEVDPIAVAQIDEEIGPDEAENGPRTRLEGDEEEEMEFCIGVKEDPGH